MTGIATAADGGAETREHRNRRDLGGPKLSDIWCPEVAQSLWGIIAYGTDPRDTAEEPSFFTELKADPGKLGLETLLAEVAKVKRVRALGLPPDLFADVAERRITRWRARAAAQYPSTLMRDHTPPVMLTLLAVLCRCRADRDHRLAGGAVRRPRACDQHAGGAEGREAGTGELLHRHKDRDGRFTHYENAERAPKTVE